MSLSDLLDRRRACRAFLPDAIAHDALLRVADAAARAPTASNVRYREIMIVEDPAVIRAVRQIHPALRADPPALMIIMTDVEMAVERVGNIGASSSLIDSGAAGENAWLAAIEDGLATGFTMISAMPGIRTILGLPDRIRVDLIMPLGLPAEQQEPLARRRPPAAVHINQYGRLDDRG